MSSPDEPINDYVDSYCWHEDGWESASEYSVQDARTTTRGQAAARFAREDGGRITDVRVWKRYARPLTRQDVWSDYGYERQLDNLEDLFACPACGVARGLACDEEGSAEPCAARVALLPTEPPEDWEPDPEGDPCWQFVHRDNPDAIPVWICAERGSRAPHDAPKSVAA